MDYPIEYDNPYMAIAEATNLTNEEVSIPYQLQDDLKCNQYILKNKTHIFYGGYEGIPENLFINFLGWIILLCLFTILRKNAWNYGRLALVQKYENRETLHGYSRYNVREWEEMSRWTHIFYGADKERSKTVDNDSVSSYDFYVHIDKGYFSWIPALFKIKDEHILAKSGRDAVQYLSFQRHIIIYMMIVCVVSIVIVLPINFQGTLEGGEKEFGHTTLSNLDPSSPFMWVHVTLAFIFLPLGILFTRRFSRLLEVQQLASSISRTLMITRVPRRSCHKDTLLRHFQESYPDLEIQDIQFAYDIHKLVLLDKERDVVHCSRLYCESYLKDTGFRLEMRAYRCGLICGCCDIFGCPKVDAIEYYTQEEHTLIAGVEDEKVKALQRPTGIAFVTFDTIENAKQVMQDHSRACRCGHNPPSSSVSSDLKPYNWMIRVAPAPEDIYWSNLSVTTKHWYLKAIFINFILFLFLFFLTTPPVIINSLDLSNIFYSEKLTKMSPLLSEFLPTLMLWTIAALMPVMVSYSDQFMSHWTRSGQNHAVMRKTFIFLLFMLIILPSLGFTSAKAFLEWFVHEQRAYNSTYRWECMFLPDNGAFFVNYVITSAFIGTALELIRFPELFLYIILLGLARSEAETASIRRNILYEFQFGVQYAWMLLIFAMTVIYSVSCPLITPFGLLYLIFKHLVDKYNIYFAYGPSKIRKSIHTSAVNFVIVSVVILQLCLLFFSLLRQGLKNSLTIYSIVLLCLAFVVFVTHILFHWFKDFSPIEYKTGSDDMQDNLAGDEELSASVNSGQHSEFDHGLSTDSSHFVPPVLRSISGTEEDERFYSSSRLHYGTDEPSSSGAARVLIESDRFPHSSQNEFVSYQNYSQGVISNDVNSVLPVNIDKDSHSEIEITAREEEETVYQRTKQQHKMKTNLNLTVSDSELSSKNQESSSLKIDEPAIVQNLGKSSKHSNDPTIV